MSKSCSGFVTVPDKETKYNFEEEEKEGGNQEVAP